MIKPLTFLLIDDDEDDREFFEMALENISEEVLYIGAKSGHEALDMLRSHKVEPDYIFLDLNMPRMSGKECLAELKKDILTSSIPVIIFSTSSDHSDKKETINMGAIDFVTKPNKISDLSNILNSFIINKPQNII